MYEDILVPTDGSPAADSAIEHAVNVAERYDATIHALYVVDDSAYATLDAASETVVEALESEGEEAVGRIATAARNAGIDAVTTVTTGVAYRTILDHVANDGIDLVAMGTHGRRGLDRYLLGSVTERVVRTSDVPVLAVRQPEDSE